MRVSQEPVSKNLIDFQYRIATTLQNYDHLLREIEKKNTNPSISEQPLMENNEIVAKMLQEHRKNKSTCLKNALKSEDLKTERFERDNGFNIGDTSRGMKDNNEQIPFKNISNLSRNYMSFSPDNCNNNNDNRENKENKKNQEKIKENLEKSIENQEKNIENQEKNIENPLKIKETIEKAPKTSQSSNFQPIPSIYGQLRISDLLQQSEQDQKTLETLNPSQRKSTFETLKVEDRLALHDIARSLKIHSLMSEKQSRETQEIKEIPRISENSRILAEKSLRIQHNPDIIKRLLEDHKVSQLRQEKEMRKREKFEQNLYSFNPQINSETQNIKRTIEDLFLWDRKKREKEENIRNLIRKKEFIEIRENLQTSRISQNSKEILNNLGRNQRKEPIENRLFRAGNFIQAKKMKIQRENTEKIKHNNRKASSTRSTIDFRQKTSSSRKDFKGNSEEKRGNSQDFKGNRGNSQDFKGNSLDFKGNSMDFKGNSMDFRVNSQISSEIRRTLKFEESETEKYEGNREIYNEKEEKPKKSSENHEVYYKENETFNVSEVENKENLENPCFSSKSPQNKDLFPKNQESFDIFNKYLSKKLAQKSDSSEIKRKHIIPIEKEPENLLKSLKIQDPLTLFEKKPYFLKPAFEKPIITSTFSSKTSEKQSKTPVFHPENPQEIQTISKEIVENSSENHLKSLFIDSKSFFQKHHMKNNLETLEARKSKGPETSKNSLFCLLNYEERKKNKASAESLLSSLKFREQKVFSYHENRLEIQDKSSDFEEKPNESRKSFYEKNIYWLQERNQKKSLKLEEKKEFDMKECSFQPNSRKMAENPMKKRENYEKKRENDDKKRENYEKKRENDEKKRENDEKKLENYEKKRENKQKRREIEGESLSTKRTLLENSNNTINNLTNNDSYVEIYKRKRGNSLTGRK